MSQKMGRKTPVSPTRRFWQWLRNSFVSGLLILLPVGLTVYIVSIIFLKIDSIFGVFFQKLTFHGHSIPGPGFVTTILFIVLVGAVTRNFLGRKFLQKTDHVVERIPLINRLYKATKQISAVFIANHKTILKEVVLIDYPKKDVKAIAFITGKTSESILPSQQNAPRYFNVFVPTTPNPTSGFMLLVPENEIIKLPHLTVEDALKVVIAAGAVAPEDLLE